MMRRAKGLVGVLLTAVVALSSFGSADVSGEDEVDRWNVLVYLQADNNLNDLTQTDLDELMAVGSTDDVNVLVFMDKLDQPAYLYYILQGEMMLLDYEYNGVEVNTGDPVVFEKFVAYAEENYPAEHTIIFFWDHGGPTSGVGVDDTTSEGVSDWLTHHELIEALQGHRVDVMAMDECSVGQIETIYEYAMHLDTDYVVASESYIGYRGFPYDWILEKLVARPDMSAYELAVVCVEEFERLFMMTPYKTEILTTQSVFVLDEMRNLADKFGALLDALSKDIGKYRSIIRSARAGALMPWGATSAGRIDLPSFVTGIWAKAPADSAVKAAAADFLSAYDKAVPEMGVTKNSDKYNYKGMGILFPGSPNYLTISAAGMFEVYKTFDFPDDGWLQFLELYWGTELI
ncbi:MAG: clostripain-related cysteine peptidase [Thermoplasmata archaeon]